MHLKLSELVEDFDLYPRADVDSHHVLEIACAIEAGMRMPKIIIERKTKRIVDGLHRKRGYQRVYGDDHTVTVECRSYASDAELFIHAGKLNSSHGKNFTTHDRITFITKALRLAVTPAQIATALNITVERVNSLTVDRTATLHRKVIPLKRPIRHLAGCEITQQQADVIDKLGGNSQDFHVRQLLLLIENDLLDTENENLMELLRLLVVKLRSVLRAA